MYIRIQVVCNIIQYSGTPLRQTPLEKLRFVLHKEVSLIQGLLMLVNALQDIG